MNIKPKDNYGSIDELIVNYNKILSMSSIGSPPPIPTILILTGVPKRTGLSAIKIATNINARKGEAGLPIGNLPSGAKSPDELMEIIRIEEIIKALQQDSIISVAIPAGITVSASGISAVGGSVNVFCATTKISKGYAVIQ